MVSWTKCLHHNPWLSGNPARLGFSAQRGDEDATHDVVAPRLRLKSSGVMKIWACNESRCHWPAKLLGEGRSTKYPCTNFSRRALHKCKNNRASHFAIRYLALRQTGSVAVSGGQGLVQPGARQHSCPRQFTWLTRQQLQCPEKLRVLSKWNVCLHPSFQAPRL